MIENLGPVQGFSYNKANVPQAPSFLLFYPVLSKWMSLLGDIAVV